MPPKPSNPSTKDLEEAIQANQQRFEESLHATQHQFREQLGLMNTRLENQQQLLESRDENFHQLLNAKHDSLTALLTSALRQRPPPSDPPPPPETSGITPSTSLSNPLLHSPTPPSQPQTNPISIYPSSLLTTLPQPLTATTMFPLNNIHTSFFTPSTSPIPVSLPITFHHTPQPQPTIYPPSYHQSHFTPQIPPFHNNIPFGAFHNQQSPYPTLQPNLYMTPPPHNQFQPSFPTPKIQLKPFDGTEPLEWLFQAEQFFSFYNITNENRLSLASFYMKGDALSWYKWMYQNHQLFDWPTFSKAVELRFGPSTYENHQAQLFKLRQYSTVADYQTQFEKLGNRVFGLPPKALLNCFISGLIPEIRHELAVQKPYTISQAIGLAKLIEAKLKDSKTRPNKPYTNQPTQNTTLPPHLPSPKPITTTGPITSTPPSTQPTQSSKLPIRRISSAQMQERRA